MLAAADPAQPYGSVLPWPKRAGARAARVAGAYVVLLGGRAALFVERGGKSMVPLRDPDAGVAAGRARRARRPRPRGSRKRLAVERFDGEPVAESDVAAAPRRGGLPRRAAPGRAASLVQPPEGESLHDRDPALPSRPGADARVPRVRRHPADAGHVVHAPDLYDGNTFDDLDDGVGYAKQVGFGKILERGTAAAEGLPDGLVYAGFSLGVMPAQALA